MTDDLPDLDPDLDDEAPRPLSVFHYIMQRIVGPAGAVVVAYASIRAFPSLLVSQIPPIDGGDLLIVFIGSIVAFALLAAVLDRRARRKDGS